jgi:hypothetical protein
MRTIIGVPIPCFVIVIELLLSLILILGLPDLAYQISGLLAKGLNRRGLPFQARVRVGATYSSKEILFLSDEFFIVLCGYFTTAYLRTTWLSGCDFEYFIVFAKRKELQFFGGQMIQIQHNLSKFVLGIFSLKLSDLNEDLSWNDVYLVFVGLVGDSEGIVEDDLLLLSAGLDAFGEDNGVGFEGEEGELEERVGLVETPVEYLQNSKHYNSLGHRR